MKQHYEAFPKNDANFVPLSPLSFVTRTVDLFPQRTAVIYGDRRYSWRDSYTRMCRLASAIDKAGLCHWRYRIGDCCQHAGNVRGAFRCSHGRVRAEHDQYAGRD